MGGAVAPEAVFECNLTRSDVLGNEVPGGERGGSPNAWPFKLMLLNWFCLTSNPTGCHTLDTQMWPQRYLCLSFFLILFLKSLQLFFDGWYDVRFSVPVGI